MNKSTKLSGVWDRAELGWGGKDEKEEISLHESKYWVQKDSTSFLTHCCCIPCRTVEGLFECYLPCCYLLSRCFHDIKRTFIVSGELLVVYDHQTTRYATY